MISRNLVFTAPHQVEVVKEELPPPAEGEVLVQTELSAISPGTERLIYEGLAPTELAADPALPSIEGDLSFPLRYGYAAVGHVSAIGPGVEPEWIDQPVFAFHPHCDAFTIQTEDLIRLPEDMALEDAAFLPNLETAVNFIQDGAPLLGERVLVLGQGVVGLLTTTLMARSSLARVLTLDPIAARRALSREAGADASFDPGSDQDIAELESALELGEEDGGADLVYELSGNPDALNLAIQLAGFSARIVIGSWYGRKRPENLDLGGSFHRRRLTIISSQVSTIEPALRGRWTKERRIQLVLRLLNEIQPSRWVTGRYDLLQADQAYRQLDDPQSVQSLLTYSSEAQPK